jgi:hypothetical protein
MPAHSYVQIHESCVVPYRVSELGIEFCLVANSRQSRWEFPKLAMDPECFSREAILVEAMGTIGLYGALLGDAPLGEFTTSRGEECRSTTGFLMRVEQIDEPSAGSSDTKRRWCLAEEARVRIRRKPLRGFIDLALRAIPVEGPATKSRSTAPR